MYPILKRIIDFIISLSIILLGLPIFIFILFFHKIMVFKQERIGLGEVKFRLYKLKTMNQKRDEKGKLLPDHLRLTKWGRIIRKTSLDELPQLLNVLKGDMSFIGPRPLLVDYLTLYNDDQRKRHNVRPGISGWAQVNGRNNISWKEKFELDIYYVDNQSFLLDIEIIGKTILNVFTAKGINSGEKTTMERFTGNDD